MANIKRTIDIIFQGDDRLTGPAMQVVRTFKLLDRAADAVIDKLDTVADSFKRVVRDVTVMGAVFGGLAINEFRQFESAWIDIQKVTDLTVEQLEVHKDRVRELALHYGEGMTDIAKSAFDFKRTGLELVDALTLTEDALKLASAGNSDMATSTKALITIMKGFNLQATEMAHVVDAINKLSDDYAVNVGQMAEGLAIVAPSAEAAGFSMDKAAALLVPIVEVFQSGSEAAVALRRAFVKLTDDAQPVLDAFEELKLKQKDSNGELKTGKQLFYEIAEAMAKETASNQLRITAMLFGNRQTTKMVQLWRKLNYVMEIENEAAGVKAENTLKQVNLRLGSTEVAVKRVISAMKLFGIEIGYRLKPGFDAAAAGLFDLVADMSDIIDDEILDNLFKQFNELGEQLSTYFTKIGDVLPDALARVDYSDLLASIKRLLAEIDESFEEIDLTTPEGLAKAIQFVIDTIESGIDVTTGFVAIYKEVAATIVEAIKAFNGLSSESKKATGEVLAIADVMKKFGKTLGAALLLLDRYPGAVKAVVTNIGLKFDLVLARLEHFTARGEKLYADFVAGSLKLLDIFTLGLSETVEEMYNKAMDAHAKAEMRLGVAAQNLEVVNRRVADSFGNTGDVIQDATDKTNNFKESIPDVPIEVKIRMDLEEALGDPLPILTAKDLGLEGEFDLRGIWGDRPPLLTAEDLGIDRKTLDMSKAALERFMSEDLRDAVRKGEIITEEHLEELEKYSLTLQRDLKAAGAALGEVTDIELDVPDTTKFEAQQRRLLEEIKTNASTLQESFKISVASIEADATKVSSTFDSISTSIESTGSTLAVLRGDLARPDIDILTKARIERQIGEEKRYRDESFDLQKQLTEAQILLVQKRAEALTSGKPLITVNGDGLQPHLQAFMWEILSAIQVEVTEDYNNFLLGIGG